LNFAFGKILRLESSSRLAMPPAPSQRRDPIIARHSESAVLL